MLSVSSPWKGFLGWLLIALSLAAPAGAMVHPRLLDWQARLSRMLPRPVRTQVATVADGLPVTATPEDLRQALDPIAPTLPRDPLELFAGIRILQRREEVLGRFEERLALLERSLESLDLYRREVNQALRLAPQGPAGPDLEAPREGLPAPELRPDAIHVLRWLPSPGPGVPRERLRLLREAALEDTRRIRALEARTLQARDAFLEGTLNWRRHLRLLAGHLDPATGLAFPSSAAPQHPPQIEIIPPPPPLDLPEFREAPPPEPNLGEGI